MFFELSFPNHRISAYRRNGLYLRSSHQLINQLSNQLINKSSSFLFSVKLLIFAQQVKTHVVEKITRINRPTVR
jgi:hypothetical protein